jgi:hypothetical protein
MNLKFIIAAITDHLNNNNNNSIHFFLCRIKNEKVSRIRNETKQKTK